MCQSAHRIIYQFINRHFMKTNLVVALLLFIGFSLYAENENEQVQDTIQSHYLNEIIISSSTKETNDLKSLPGAVSIITPQMIEGQKIVSIKDISSTIPNFFIADYGSKLSVPVYIRGIGERSTGQSIGMYVDNMPYLDKSVFDFELVDVQRIEVLRGPQGTLYGRNAMSGIVNIFTRSALEQERMKFSVTGGNYGLFRTKGTISKPLSENFGLSLSGYYDRNDGYFKNNFNRKRADKMDAAGGRLRMDWKLNPEWTAQLTTNYDYNDQGAFPYGVHEGNNVSNPDQNYLGSYLRKVSATNLNLEYKNDYITFNSASGFLYFEDNMKMDIDYSPADVFTLNQVQRERSWTEELTVKSNTKNNYQWVFGVFGFYNDLETNALTTMGEKGIETILQKELNDISANNPRAPKLTVLNENIPIPGFFETPAYGGAIFHQSTYNNLFVDGLSVTAGIRLDYEKLKLNYDTDIAVDIEASMGGRPIGTQTYDTLLVGKESTSFTEVLPKVALKYEIDPSRYIYATVANGYKTGGYNIQMFADIAQNALRGTFTREVFPPVSEIVPYKPEYSWNYEAGFKGNIIKDVLFTEIAAFYIDVKDMQITDFVESGHGRIVKNAGKARSFGFDFGITAALTDELRASFNYGYTHATFTDYLVNEKDDETEEVTTVSYNDNHVPFAPQNTLSGSIVYAKAFQNKWIDRLNIQAQYNAAGKIYWSEKNDTYQKFYGVLNMKASVGKGIFDLSIWGKNILDTDYVTFSFENMDRNLAQRGRPFTCGVDLSVTF